MPVAAAIIGPLATLAGQSHVRSFSDHRGPVGMPRGFAARQGERLAAAVPDLNGWLSRLGDREIGGCRRAAGIGIADRAPVIAIIRDLEEVIPLPARVHGRPGQVPEWSPAEHQKGVRSG